MPLNNFFNKVFSINGKQFAISNNFDKQQTKNWILKFRSNSNIDKNSTDGAMEHNSLGGLCPTEDGTIKS